MTADKRNELVFQGHIIDSYKRCGGHARKWATELMVGMPDLICALPGWGVHLVEVKHRPMWRLGRDYPNPMTDKQRYEAGLYRNGGGRVFGFVVVESDRALGSFLVVFDPLLPQIQLVRFVYYEPGSKYNINDLLGATW